MKRKILYYLVLFSLAAFVTAPLAAQAQDSTKTTISSNKFKRWSKKPNTVVIDVRTPTEFAAGHIPGAKNMDVQETGFAHQIKSLDPARRYLLYCRSGKRSTKALKLLYQQGFTQVYQLRGGIEKWKGNLTPEPPPQ